MLFNSIDFFWFIIIVIPVYYLIPRQSSTIRVIFLLVASYFFYMYWNPWYIILIIISTLVDYQCGLLFLKWPQSKHHKIVLISAITNLSLLAIFKYTDFFLNIINLILLKPVFKIEAPMIINGYFPVGISFYTFQTMSYSIDIYRGRAKVEKNFWRFALYVAYFPQLVAGPIEKARSLIRRLQNNIPRARPLQPTLAIQQIFFGLFKKIAVADTIGVLIQPIFQSPQLYNGNQIFLAALLFSVQIYCDFSGYTDIAIGISRLFGIKLMRNFAFPYFSKDITEFWRRWHISLSSWLKEYLYISLGGNRKGNILTYCNLMITMLLGGLWHGPGWNFILWGFCHGLFLVLHKLRMKYLPLKNTKNFLIQHFKGFLSRCFTFLIVSLTWIPFVCPDFKNTIATFKQIFTWNRNTTNTLDPTLTAICIFLSLIVLFFDIYFLLEEKLIQIKRIGKYLRLIFVVVFIFFIFIFSAPEARQFIYFAF